MPLCYLLSLNPTSYGILKNLRGSGLEVHLFHVKGSLDKFLDDGVIVQRHSISEEPHAVVEELRRRKSGSKATVFTSSDREISFLEEFRNELQDHVSLPSLSSETIRLINDKYAFFLKTNALGILTPCSYVVTCGQPDAHKPDLGWPRLIKPVFSEQWKTAEASRALGGKKAFVVNTPADLASRIQQLHKFSRTLLIQEIIDTGEDGSYSFCSYSDNQGKVRWGFVTQKLLQYPDRFGTAILCGTADRPDITAFGRCVVESLGVNGVAETEILVDRRTGHFVVIEINTRHWLQHRLSNRLGVNITLLDYYFRHGNEAAAREMLAKANDFRPALWIDDAAYVSHAVKNWFRPSALRIGLFRNRAMEFSLLERRSLWPVLLVFAKRLSTSIS